MTWKKYGKYVAVVLGLSATAYAAPWDIDLVDAVSFRGYEWRMAITPENAVSQNQYRPFKLEQTIIKDAKASSVLILQANDLTAEAKKNQKALQAEQQKAQAHYTSITKTNPDALDMTKNGEQMFNVYCTACHGKQGMGNAPVTWTKRSFNKAGKDVKRWTSVPQIYEKLACYTDGELYNIIRNGKGNMPSYGHAMEDREIWALVQYTREGLKRPYDTTDSACQ